jgi:hypothetical protein
MSRLSGSPRGRADGYAPVGSFDEEAAEEDLSDEDLGILCVHLESQVPVGAQDEAMGGRFWLRYVWMQIWGQAKIVTPLCAYVVGFKELALAGATEGISTLVLAVLATICGLAAFLEGLRFGIMPLSEALGKTLPRKAPLPVTLLIAGILGVGVTFAEPAIGALQAVGSDIDCAASPYLFVLLNGWSLRLVVAVGIGVGLAAVRANVSGPAQSDRPSFGILK